jgi:hypothetical protein
MTKIYVAKYVPDPARWEPRNVGVVVARDGRAAARFIAEKPDGSIDGHRVRHDVGAPAQIYREWVQYWQRMIAEQADLDALPTREGADFMLVEAGETWMADARASLVDQVAEYFSRLVQPDDVPGEAELRRQVEHVLATADVSDKVQITRDVVVPGKHIKGKESVKFAYGFVNGHLTVGHRVPLGIETLVHDALYRYIAIGDDVPKVSFIQTGQGESRAHLATLRAYSTVIDVAEPDAAAQLESVLSQ